MKHKEKREADAQTCHSCTRRRPATRACRNKQTPLGSNHLHKLFCQGHCWMRLCRGSKIWIAVDWNGAPASSRFAGAEWTQSRQSALHNFGNLLDPISPPGGRLTIGAQSITGTLGFAAGVVRKNSPFRSTSAGCDQKPWAPDGGVAVQFQKRASHEKS